MAWTADTSRCSPCARRRRSRTPPPPRRRTLPRWRRGARAARAGAGGLRGDAGGGPVDARLIAAAAAAAAPGLRTCALAGCGAKEAHPSTSRAAPHFQCCSIKSHNSCTAVGPYKGCQVRMHERDWCARARTCVDSRARPPRQR